jgi:hypothetical protein
LKNEKGKKLNGQKRMISAIKTQGHLLAPRVQTLQKSLITRKAVEKVEECMSYDPYRVRVLFGNDPERTRALVAKLTATLTRKSIFSRCFSVRFDEPNKYHQAFFNGHCLHYWMTKKMDIDCFSDLLEDDQRCLVVLHNVDGIHHHDTFIDFVDDLHRYRFIVQFIMTTSKKETYDALLKPYDTVTKEQMVKSLVHRV